MTSKVHKSSTMNFKSLKSFSCLPANSPDDDHQDQLQSVQAPVDGFCGERDQWPERYEMAVFLLTQFNVHYMSWIKNSDHLADYMERFSCLYERVLQLPEFTGQVDGALKDWLIDRSTTKCLQYRRQLVISLVSLTGPKTSKRMRIALMQKDSKSSSVVTTTGDSTPDDLMTDDDSDEGKDDDEDMPEETAFELMTDDEDNPPEGVARNECGALGDETAFVSQTSLEEQTKEQANVDKSEAATVANATTFMVLGEVDLRAGVAYVVSLPKETNAVGNHIYLKLALIDSAAQDGREHISIHISEAMVTGFSGFTKRFNITLNENDPNETKDFIEFELSLKWQIDTKCFQELVTRPEEILHKLPGAIFLLGDYYWHFYRGFYRWAALECQDSYLRYLAIQSFHELSLMLPPAILYDDMTRIFVSLYPPGGYPLPDELPLINEHKQEYLCEPLSQLDNAIAIFAFLFKEEQIELVRHLEPYAATLIRLRYRFTKRLVKLLRQYLANYDVDDLETAVLPLATTLLTTLAQIDNPAEELHDPKDDHVNWPMVNSMATELATLVVECVQCSRPSDWAQLPIGDAQMKSTCRLLERAIQALFTVHGIEFLKAIYVRMRSKKVLNDHHLAPFLTASRIKQYRKWFS